MDVNKFMAEYIKRKTIINRIKEHSSNVYGIDLDDPLQFAGKSVDDRICEGLYEAIELINELPCKDVVPVVYGRWTHLGGDEWFCSACGFVISTEGSWDKPTKKYCEDCGAKMEQEANE